jgi:hypothetical protein
LHESNHVYDHDTIKLITTTPPFLVAFHWPRGPPANGCPEALKATKIQKITNIYIYIKQQEEVTVGGIEFLRKVDESFSFTFSGVEK